MAYGIESLNIYAGLAQIPVSAIFSGRGLDPERLSNLMMLNRSVGLPFEDPVTNAVNVAKPIVDGLDETEREAIEILIVSTESGLDLSKSVASYVHEYLGLSRNCRILEVKQACYAATGALQLAAGYLASGISPLAKALIIATDIALVDGRAEYAEPTTGHGAAALLLSDVPRVLALDLGAFGCYGFETMDSARPTPEFDIADVDRSLFAYLDCLTNSFEDYCSRVEGANFITSFDYLAMHTPFSALAKAAHRKMMHEVGAPADRVEEDFRHRVAPSLEYPTVVGNLCSGSVYLALASLLEHAEITGRTRVGLYSYGSGCASEFFSGVVDGESVDALRKFAIGRHLAQRLELSFEEYDSLLPETLRSLIPEQRKVIELHRYDRFLHRGNRGPLLVHSRTEDYHRVYEWY